MMNLLSEFGVDVALICVIGFALFQVARRNRASVKDSASTKKLTGCARKLRFAGLNPSSSLWFFHLVRVLLAVLVCIIASTWIDDWLYLAVIAVFTLFLPDLWLRKKVINRQKRIRSSLSLFVDLITSLSRSGMNLERTFTFAAREGFPASHPLAVEVALLGQELKFGRERESAFQLLAERTGVTELKALASSIRMGLRSGAPVEAALESQAEFLRFRQQENASKALAKAAAGTIIPVFLCGIPLWAVVVYFPLVLEILETVKNLTPF